MSAADDAPPPNNTVKCPPSSQPGDPGHLGTAPGWPCPPALPVGGTKKGRG